MTTAQPPAEKLQADVVMATAFGVLKQHWLVLLALVFAALYAELVRIKDGYDPAVEVFA